MVPGGRSHDRTDPGQGQKPFSIIAETTAEVDVLVGEKSVLSYLLEPVLRARGQALRESWAMTLIVAAGSEHDMLVRWSDMAHKLEHGCVILPPASLLGGPQIGAGVCLYDMGPRGDADPQSLFDAITACPDTSFIAMSPRPEAQEGLRLLRGGARGYSNRLVSIRVLAVLISTVSSGEIWAGKQVTDYLLKAALAKKPRPAVPKPDLFGQLTAHEVGIAKRVAAGHSNKVIATDCGISERTVKAHLNSIFHKTGIRNRVQLALAISQENQDPRFLSNA